MKSIYTSVKTLLAKNVLATLIICFCIGNSLYSQNLAWSLAPKYLNGLGISSLPTNTNPGYQGDTAFTASNMQLDAQGNILFFVVDGVVYKGDGSLIGRLISYDYNPSSNGFVTGASEIVIMPDPGNCSRYYIFASSMTGLGSGNDYPYYAIIDMSTGTLIQNTNSETAFLLTNLLPNGIEWNYQGTSNRVTGITFAASNLRSDNSRFVFVSNNFNQIFRFKVTTAGIAYDGVITMLPSGVNYGSSYCSEMELINLSNGNYRIATLLDYDTSNIEEASKVFTAELNPQGNEISRDIIVFSSLGSSNLTLMIKGLEFNEDGSKLYIAHTLGSIHTNPIEYYDFTSQSLTALNLTNANDFQWSQIELAKDGKLYLATYNRMATIDPTNNSWNPNAVSFSGFTYYPNNGVSYIQPSSNDATKLYTLPDQIDGMDYSQFVVHTYDIETPYTANDNLTSWTQNSNPWNINSNDIYFEDNLIIPAGKTLTIQNMTFHFAPNAKVIIEQGAKITLNGSTFTNAKFCGDQQDFWQGVEVWGTSNQNQYPTNHPTYQGMLVLTNQSSIENAHVGATNWKVNDWDALGGVIQSYDSKFLNNQRDVAFMTYQNHMPTGVLTGDLSSFTNTDFVSDNNFMEKGLSIEPHISMWQVNNIRFTNCHFANNVSVNKLYSTSPATGIKTINAGFIVRPGCSITLPYGQACPTANLLKSSFSGLKLGIEATSASTTQTVTVEQTDFLDNFNGINIKSINGVSINRNTIELGMAGYNMATIPAGTGIAISNSTGYLVEENNIYGNLRPNSFLGIVVNNSGTDDNRIYKNTVTNMVNGGLALGLNRNGINLQGLQFLCNEINKNASGIYVGRTAKQGIRYYQGENATATTPKIPAANIFHGNITDISNYASPFVYIYDYNIAASLPTFTPFNGVHLDYFDISRSCPSSFDGIVFLPFARSSMIDSLSGKMGTQKTAYDNLDFTLQSLIDNGNTEQFKDSIVYDWSDDAWKLRAKLLAASPYVSSPSLLQTAAQSVLPDGMLLEVLLANPDATRGEDFINELKIAAPGFPDYMLDFVRDNRDATTLRTNMESQLSILHTDLTQTRDILRYLRKNQDEYTYADRLNTVQMGNEIYNKAELMDFYIENQEFAKADSVLNEIAMAEEYAGDLTLIDNYDDYLTFRAGLGTRTIEQLDSSEIAQLEILAAGDNRVAEYAQNILCFFYHICYDQMPDLNAPHAKSMLSKQSSPKVNKNDLFYHIKVYPNPAVDYYSIGWEIYDELNDAYYSIHDINGREVMRGEITGNKNEKVIDTRELRNGIYVIGIYNQNQLKVNKKLVVNR